MILLNTYPKTRISPWVVYGKSDFNFTVPTQNVKDSLIAGFPNQMEYRFKADFYKKIGVDIVTETVFDYPYPYITEKTYRSIACLRPFIMIGPYHTLNFVRSLGFKTFSAIIDEDYDSIRDPIKRFISVCNSIHAFVARPLADVKHDVASIADILIHNNSVLLKLETSELEKFKLQVSP